MTADINQTNKIIDQINDFVVKQNLIIYDIGQRLSAIKRLEYYELYGYATWVDFCHSSIIHMSPGQMSSYLSLYENCKELGYNREDCTRLIDEHGVKQLTTALSGLEKKLSFKKIREHIQSMKPRTCSIGIAVSHTERTQLIRKLKANHGLIVKDGRNMNLSEAVLNAIGLK